MVSSIGHGPYVPCRHGTRSFCPPVALDDEAGNHFPGDTSFLHDVKRMKSGKKKGSRSVKMPASTGIKARNFRWKWPARTPSLGIFMCWRLETGDPVPCTLAAWGRWRRQPAGHWATGKHDSDLELHDPGTGIDWHCTPSQPSGTASSPASGFRLQASGFRLQAAAHRLPDSWHTYR